MEVLDGIRAIQIEYADDLDTEVYLLECESGLILVDVGFTPRCHKNIQKELDTMGMKWDDIKMIIITHAHGDHINNLAKFRSLTNADVMVGFGDEDALEERTGVRAEIILCHGDVIDVCGNIETIHVPGHSLGNLCLYLQKYKAIIAGDTIFGDNVDYPHIFPPPEKYSSDVDSARNNLKILMDYDFDILLLTHGRNILKGAKKIVKEMLVREKIL